MLTAMKLLRFLRTLVGVHGLRGAIILSASLLGACASTGSALPPLTFLRTAMPRRPAKDVPKDVRKGLKPLVCTSKLLVALQPISWSRPLYDFEMASEGVTLLTSDAQFVSIFGCKRFVNWTTHRLLLVWYDMTDANPIAFKAGVRRGGRLTFDLVTSRVCLHNTPHRLRATRLVLLPANDDTIEVRRVAPPSAQKPCPKPTVSATPAAPRKPTTAAPPSKKKQSPTKKKPPSP